MANYLDGYDDHLKRNSVSGYFAEVDNLTKDVGSHSYIGNLKEITKQHWKPDESRPNCSNKECRKAFSTVLDRPHHCRRCGDVFCNACLQHRRRLNKLAHFDPEGQLYKVCKSCFEKDQITDGQVFSHTHEFQYLRHRLKNYKEGLASNMMNLGMCLEKECDRLVQGFASSVGKSEIKRTLHDLRSVMLTPEWTKSSSWLRANTADRCSVCQSTFGIIKTKKFCVVCGLCICKNCSSQDLLVYFSDSDQQAKGLPKLAIIKIVGCPEVEPEVSLYLRICPCCKEKMIDRQVKLTNDEAVTFEPDTNFLERLHRLDLKFHTAEEGVKKYLPKYENVVESLEDGSRASHTESNTKTLAKAQGDLADVLALHVTNVQQLKKVAPKSGTQSRLLKNYIRAKCEFYMGSMCLYRSLKEKLSHSVPVESLDFIQRIMDKNAAISTHLYLRQLVYELLHLTERHSIDDDLPAFLMRVEQEIEEDLKQCLILNKENVEEHFELVKDMIRSRLKEHKLVRPSQKCIKQQGSKYVVEFMLMRTEEVVTQVMNQLQVMSARRSFLRGKKALEMALNGVKERKMEAEDESKEFHIL